MPFYMVDNPNPNTAQGVLPRRGGAKLSGTIIVHTAEMYGALNTAAFCGRRTDYGCYHTIVDDSTIIEMYPYDWETWQDSETNNWAVGISAACRAADWNGMASEIQEGYYRNLAWAAADFVTYMRSKGIEVPRRRITGAEARARVPGFAAHGDSGIARTDPGVQFDWARFFRYIEESLNGEEEMAITDADADKIAEAILNKQVVWYGFDGKTPSSGRNTTTLKVQLGYLDASFAGLSNAIKDKATGKIVMTPEDLASLAKSLKDTLAPGLASELAKRLAE